jgi:hypothetical protein
MSINIYQLKINILTLIPNNPLIELTSDILFTEKKTIGGSVGGSKFPFFTDSKLYPIDKLESFEYTDIIKFFFDKSMFTDTINNHTKTQSQSKTQSKTQKKKKKNMKKTTMNSKQK